MAIKNTAWHQVEPGQIVTFMYKSKGETRGYKRTILMLNPDLRFRKKTRAKFLVFSYTASEQKKNYVLIYLHY